MTTTGTFKEKNDKEKNENYEMEKQRRSEIIGLSIMGRKLRKQKVLFLYCGGSRDTFMASEQAGRPKLQLTRAYSITSTPAHPFLLSIAVLSTDRGKTEKINESYTGMASRLKRSNVLFAFGQRAVLLERGNCQRRESTYARATTERQYRISTSVKLFLFMNIS